MGFYGNFRLPPLYLAHYYTQQEASIRIGILTTHLTDEEDRLVEAGKEKGQRY